MSTQIKRPFGPIQLFRTAPRRPKGEQRGRGYAIVTVCMYDTELAKVDIAVERIKSGGLRRMNRSLLIQIALDALYPGETKATPIAPYEP